MDLGEKATSESFLEVGHLRYGKSRHLKNLTTSS